MAQINNLKVFTFNTEDQDEITPDSTFEEMKLAMLNGNGVSYDLGKYFDDQNDDNIGSHWSFLVDISTGTILNGYFNTQIP